MLAQKVNILSAWNGDSFQLKASTITEKSNDITDLKGENREISDFKIKNSRNFFAFGSRVFDKRVGSKHENSEKSLLRRICAVFADQYE